jgi:hypothetical protein
MLHKTYKTENKEFSEKDRTIIHYISTKNADEFGEVLEPGGMDDSRFKAVLWSHSLGRNLLDDRIPPPSELVIGKSLWRRADENGVMAKTEFADTPLGNDVMRFNAEGYINSWSVGWKPKGAKLADKSTGITFYPKWYLYEYSSVILPANPDAVNLMMKDAKSDGMKNLLKHDNDILLIKNEINCFNSRLEKMIGDFEDSKQEIANLKNVLDEIKNKMKTSVISKRNFKAGLINEVLSDVFFEITGRKN